MAANRSPPACYYFNTRGYEMVYEITLRRWMGLDGRLRKLGPFRMVSNAHPGDALTCQGFVQIDVWVDSPRGEAAKGQAVVSLPLGGS